MNPHLKSLRFAKYQARDAETMASFAQAIKQLPVILSLEFESCFNDIQAFKIQEGLYTGLKRRKRPIRKLKMQDMKLSDLNLFQACAFANKGYVCDELTLSSAVLEPSRGFTAELTGGILSGLVNKL